MRFQSWISPGRGAGRAATPAEYRPENVGSRSRGGAGGAATGREIPRTHVSARRAHSMRAPALPAFPTSISGVEGTPVHRLQPSEGVYLYVVGLVIVVTHPGRFWFGFTLAVGPIMIGPFGRAFGSRTSRNA